MGTQRWRFELTFGSLPPLGEAWQWLVEVGDFWWRRSFKAVGLNPDCRTCTAYKKKSARHRALFLVRKLRQR